MSEYIAKASIEPRDYRVVFLIQESGAASQSSDRRPVPLFQGRQCREDMFRRLPQLFLSLPQIFQVGIIDAPCLMDAAGELI